LAQLGLAYQWLSDEEVSLTPADEWRQPDELLDCGNSGTTMRLLSGLIASRPLDCVMTGDESLSRRPMKRVAEPLRLMGASVEGDSPPLHVRGAELEGIDYTTPVASAQIKSCVLLAGLRASGSTSVTESAPSRDHTERMLTSAGVRVERKGLTARVAGGSRPNGFQIAVPGDISSAAFFMVAAAMLSESSLSLRQLGTNPLRTGVLDVLRDGGAELAIEESGEELGEPVADVRVSATNKLRAFTIEKDLVPKLIDEIPVLAVLATQCEGTSVIRDARELRVKESDRIELMADGLRRMGAQVEAFEDGMAITGPTPLTATKIDARGDHRIAMAFAIGGLIAEGTTEIEGAESIQTSFPGFEEELRRLCIV
jgi:3-phosphoshikimate 1-carboxyvinyltransferase